MGFPWELDFFIMCSWYLISCRGCHGDYYYRGYFGAYCGAYTDEAYLDRVYTDKACLNRVYINRAYSYPLLEFP